MSISAEKLCSNFGKTELTFSIAARLGLADADDWTHIDYAIEHQRVIVTCDEGFERYHAECQAQSKPHAGFVYLRMQDQCQSISLVVREILFLHQAADYETDLYNQVWRA